MSKPTVFLLSALLAMVGPAARGGPLPAGPNPSTGPVAIEPPPGAVVARDEEELRRLVADGPSVIWLEAKTYRTPLTIKRPLAIHGRKGATLEAPPTGTVVTVTADDVVLDNLILRGGGHNYVAEDAAVKAKGARVEVRHVMVDGTLFGVAFEQCGRCLVEDTLVRGADVPMVHRGDGIKLWEAHESIVRRNWVEHVRDVVVWYSRHVVCEDNVVRDSRYGTHFMYAHDSIVRKSTLLDNVVGVFVMYSARLVVEENLLAGARGAAGMGLGFKESDGVSVHGNTLLANTTGLFLDRSPTDPLKRVFVRDNQIRLNQVGLSFHGEVEGVSFLGNDLVNNASLIEVSGGGNALALEFEGNHFGEYAGYDLDFDGTGDVPFTFAKLSSELSVDHPQLSFMQGTVAMTLIDAVSRTFPLLAPHPMLIDKKPAMRPHRSLR